MKRMTTREYLEMCIRRYGRDTRIPDGIMTIGELADLMDELAEMKAEPVVALAVDSNISSVDSAYLNHTPN